MKAITLWSEWAHAVVYRNKRIENRNHKPPKSLIGQRVAIHAGKHIGGRPGRPATIAGARALQARHKIATGDWLTVIDGNDGAIITWLDGQAPAAIITSAIVCTAILGEPIENVGQDPPPWADPDSLWWWPLEDVQRIDPIPCSGKQGFWDCPYL